MSLIKKISTALAIGALSLGLATNVIAEPSRSEMREYKNLYVAESEEGSFFCWDWDNDGYPDGIALFQVLPEEGDEDTRDSFYRDSFYSMNFLESWKDLNKDRKVDDNEWSTEDEEYESFIGVVVNEYEDSLKLYKDEDKNGIWNKVYCYTLEGRYEDAKFHYFLKEICEDENGNLRIEKGKENYKVY